jgi:hypothetical protein
MNLFFKKKNNDFNKEMNKYLENRTRKDNVKVHAPVSSEDEKETLEAINKGGEHETQIIEGEKKGLWERIKSIFVREVEEPVEEEEDFEDKEEDFEEEEFEKPRRSFFQRLFGIGKEEEYVEEEEEKEEQYEEIIEKLSGDLKRVFTITNSIITSLPKRYVEKVKNSKEFEEYKGIIERFNSFKKGWNEMKKED